MVERLVMVPCRSCSAIIDLDDDDELNRPVPSYSDGPVLVGWLCRACVDEQQREKHRYDDLFDLPGEDNDLAF